MNAALRDIQRFIPLSGHDFFELCIKQPEQGELRIKKRRLHKKTAGVYLFTGIQ